MPAYTASDCAPLPIEDVPATDSPSEQSQEQSQEQDQHQRPRSRSSTRSYSSASASGGGTSCDRDSISEMAESDVVDVRAVAAGTHGEDTSDNHHKEQRSRWSATLRSPTAGGAFSPSLELNAKSSTSIHTSSGSGSASLHGLGLRAASDRARTLSRCGKRCATLLADVATLHDAWAKSMLQSCHNLAALDGGAASASSTGIFAPSVSPLLHETNRRLTSFAKQTQGLAICLRGSVARPLHGSSSAMAEAVPYIFNRYALARAECASKRQSALRARARYGKAVGEAEAAIGTLRRAKNQEENGNDITDATATGAASASASAENGSDILSWEDLKRKLFVGGKKQGGLSQPSQLVMKALEEVQRCEAEYRRLVEEENRAVSRAQTMEVTALDSLQKLEEERLQFLVETLGRALQAERGALDKMDLLSVPHAQLGGEGVDDAASATSDANDPSVGSQLQLSSSSIDL